MASVNVYVTDELKERLDESGLNLSAVARDCWERELVLSEVEEGEIRVDLPEEEVRFVGRLLARGDVLELYLAGDDRLVWVEEERVYTSDRDEVDYEALWGFFRDREAADEAARLLGIKKITYL